jgi:hypothetical protein
MTKPTKSSTVLPAEEPISADLLLRTHTLTEQVIEQVKKANNEAGLQIATTDFWAEGRKRAPANQILVQYEEPIIKERKLRWLKQTRNLPLNVEDFPYPI